MGARARGVEVCELASDWSAASCRLVMSAGDRSLPSCVLQVKENRMPRKVQVVGLSGTLGDRSGHGEPVHWCSPHFAFPWLLLDQGSLGSTSLDEPSELQKLKSVSAPATCS